jgi:NAD(P)-dependent dehydrogenase (short-subunit alcohol dehydrogenase family)
MSLFDLTGKVAVVTGSIKGIGRGIAEQLVAHGAKVVISSRTAADCREAVGAINNAAGAEVSKYATCDLDDRADIERFAGEAITAFGRVDLLVSNAAALAFIGPAEDTPDEEFARLLNTNVHHNFRLCHAFRNALAETKGSLVLIGSIAGHSPGYNLFAYGASKAAVAHMTRSLADEYVKQGIRVNCISPGFVRSYTSGPIFEQEAALGAIVSSIPLRRAGEPDDIAGAVIFLASAAGSYVVGQTIIVDGGRVALSAPPTDSESLSASR